MIAGINIKTPCQSAGRFCFGSCWMVDCFSVFRDKDPGVSQAISVRGQFTLEGPAAVVLGDGDQQFIVARVQVDLRLVVQAKGAE